MTGRRGRRPPFDVVVKIGGSLQRWRRLPELVGRLAASARATRILVVPGGGRFADLVRAEWRRHGLDEPTAHRMALRAMDQYGLMIASFAGPPGGVARPVATLAEAARAAAAGRLPILIAAPLIEDDRRLERTFRLTSDSIAAHLAARVRAPRLVLLKSVSGRARPIEGRAAARRLARRGVVDPLFPALMPAGAETWVLNPRRAVQRAALSAALNRPRRSGSNRPSRPPAQRAPRAPM
jgi:aspartokinase-like uncharacterized kinase